MGISPENTATDLARLPEMGRDFVQGSETCQLQSDKIILSNWGIAMMIWKLLLLAFTAISLSGCEALIAAPVVLPLLAAPSNPSGGGPSISDTVAPVPGEAVFYSIQYREHDNYAQPPLNSDAVSRPERVIGVYNAVGEYSPEWQSIGPSPADFLKVEDIDVRDSSSSVTKLRIVRLKATAENPGTEGSNPSFTGIKQTRPHARYTTHIIYRPQKAGDRAGVLVWQNHNHYIFCGASLKNGKPAAVFVRHDADNDPPEGTVLASYPLAAESLEILSFSIKIENDILSCTSNDAKNGSRLLGQTQGVFTTAKTSSDDQGVLIGAHAYSPDR